MSPLAPNGKHGSIDLSPEQIRDLLVDLAKAHGMEIGEFFRSLPTEAGDAVSFVHPTWKKVTIYRKEDGWSLIVLGEVDRS